ncbi:10420_t:CDS:2 [Diversispora eburnea]|uniref:Nucleolar protein 56 n=1 Tax=Diversispora eburnea TaxID=1213867 RepID=A0A9N8UXT8_9GLOM|nr:10420_t:CDS:2 [Diversispora eburnea]
MVNYLLFETAFGYALFEVLQTEEIGSKLERVQKVIEDLVKFGKTVKLKSFVPFKSAVHALENANDISEGVVNEHLKAFLEMNLPRPGKKKKFVLGVSDKNLAGSIKSELGYECETSEIVLELVRGIRLHADKLLHQVKEGELVKAQLGLGHSYSRAKVKFNVNRADNMIIQAISLLDQLDKDINTFAMRVREWYSWHFPELVKIINDNHKYSLLAKFIQNKSKLTEQHSKELTEITGDESSSKRIIDAARTSMGTDISDLDMINIQHFAERVINLAEYRKKLYEYLLSKMHSVAPNLSALIGEVVGARLISRAGSLTNLSKYPASTVQILGTKNKGRISRFLANKCTIASRIDCFTEALKNQVEDRLLFYEKGTPTPKNVDVIKKVMEELKGEESKINMEVDEIDEADTIIRKRKASSEEPIIINDVKPKKSSKSNKEKKEDEITSESSKKKDKKEKKNKG